MGRSATQPQYAFPAESSPSPNSSSSSNPLSSESTVYEKHNRNPRRRGSKSLPKAGKDPSKQNDVQGHGRGPISSHSRNAYDSSRVSDDTSCAERPDSPQKQGVTEAPPAEKFMAREACASHGLDAFFIYVSHRMDVLFTLCRVWLVQLYVKQKPRMEAFAARMLEWRCQLQWAIRLAWPPLRHALLVMSGIVVTLGISWLSCIVQGCKSLVRLGSAAFFVIVCCSTLSLGILGGFFKLFLCLVSCAVAAFFAGYVYGLVLFGIISGLILWFYGSFWLTCGVLLLGGTLFILDQQQPALFVLLFYSIYTAKAVGGWLVLFLCINLSFVLSSVMIYLLNLNDTDSKGQDFPATSEGDATKANRNRTRRGKPSQASDAMPSSDTAHQTGMGTTKNASTSEGEASAVDKEVERLLGCNDHYAALELPRFTDVDLTSLKKDYKKKAMLVHPDKNLGNAVSEEAFKRLQNAYEVLLDPSKKQAYDDELKREEVLAALKRFQQEVSRNGRAGTSDNWRTQSDDDCSEGLATRRVVCKKCNNTHRWVSTDRNKLHARWCQECQDHHQAKDGDGWVEQKENTFFYGMFRKVDMPQAYACADSKVYEVTEWVHCQGMKCIPNTHKPSFHVSTAGLFKNATRGPRPTSKASFGNACDSFPFAHMNENMTEEEFLKWLQNAMASGTFHDMNEAPDQADAKSAAGAARAKPSKKKRKGKGKW